MLNIEYFFKKQHNTYKILFYTLIYKYLFCYISFIIFIYGLFHNKIDLCCGHNTKFWDIITCVFFYNLLIIFILTIINIILTLLNIYNFNKINNNIKNNEYLNKIKKINKYELLTIIFCIILLITTFIIFRFFTNLRLSYYIFRFFTKLIYFYYIFSLIILTIFLGIFPISILEILFYFENEKDLLSLKYDKH